jgi:hypothetical protein
MARIPPTNTTTTSSRQLCARAAAAASSNISPHIFYLAQKQQQTKWKKRFRVDFSLSFLEKYKK